MRCFETGCWKLAQRWPAGFEPTSRPERSQVDGEACQAERDLAAAVASSSNAAEMSPMLITPIRL